MNEPLQSDSQIPLDAQPISKVKAPKAEVFIKLIKAGVKTATTFFKGQLKKIPFNLDTLFQSDLLEKIKLSNALEALKAVGKGLGILSIIFKVKKVIITIRDAYNGNQEKVKGLPLPLFIFVLWKDPIFESLIILLKILKLVVKPLTITGGFLISLISSLVKGVKLFIAYLGEEDTGSKNDFLRKFIINLFKFVGAGLLLSIAIWGAAFSPVLISIFSFTSATFLFTPKVAKLYQQHTNLQSEEALSKKSGSSFIKFIAASLVFLVGLNTFSLAATEHLGIIFSKAFLESLTLIAPAFFVGFCTVEIFFNVMNIIQLARQYSNDLSLEEKLLLKKEIFDQTAKTLGMLAFSVIAFFNPIVGVVAIGVALAIYIGLDKFFPNWKENLMNFFTPKSSPIESIEMIELVGMQYSQISEKVVSSKSLQTFPQESDEKKKDLEEVKSPHSGSLTFFPSTPTETMEPQPVISITETTEEKPLAPGFSPGMGHQEDIA